MNEQTNISAEEVAASLSARQRLIVTDCLGADDDFGYWNFKALARYLGCEREDIRADIHGLRDLGLVTFCAGLTTEDGEFYGSGYALNRAGQAVANAVLQCSQEPTP